MKLPQIQYKGLIVLIILLLSSLFCFPVFAYEEIDENRPMSLTVINQIDGEPIKGVEFQLYKVANITKTDPFQIMDDFQDSGISLSMGATPESWFERASTLEAYLVEQKEEDNQIQPIGCTTTNEKGIATFYNLDVGLYLLVGKELKNGNTICVPLESLIPLPCFKEDNAWDYNPTAYVKNETRFISNQKIDLSVVKIWDDTGYENQRPSQVTVTLYQDDIEYSTVELNAANNWRYTWKKLDPNSDWDLVEREVPDGYTVTSVLDGKVFVVTNTRSKDASPEPTPTPTPSESPTPEPSKSPTPVPNESSTPGSSESPDSAPTDSPVNASNQSPVSTPDKSSSPASNKLTTTPLPNDPTISDSSVSIPTLPQTGQLWWPVSVLSVCGLLLFLIGWMIQEKGNTDDKWK